MGIGRSIYEKTPMGASESAAATNADLERFQLVVAELDTLEGEGLIEITDKHTESETGHRYVDLVRFKRIR